MTKKPGMAKRTKDVSFIINRAPSALPWIETNLWQIRHELLHKGVDARALEEALRIRGMAWEFVVEVDADPALVGGEKWQRINADLAEFERLYGNTAAWFWMKKLPDYDPVYYRRKAAFMGYDPKPYIEQLSVPMLDIFERDDEMSARPASNALERRLLCRQDRPYFVGFPKKLTLVGCIGFAELRWCLRRFGRQDRRELAITRPRAGLSNLRRLIACKFAFVAVRSREQKGCFACPKSWGKLIS